MKKATFKVGDKVYCPNVNTKISIVREFGQVLALTFGKSHIPFDEYGMSTITKMPVVFHATAENHALLEKLYSVKFEAPSKPKNPKEIIQAMLDDGWHSVDDKLPTISDQYWIAYCAVHKTNRSEKLEFDYCTAHFNEFEKRWYVKDQMFYTQRRCKVVYWQALPNPPTKK